MEEKSGIVPKSDDNAEMVTRNVSIFIVFFVCLFVFFLPHPICAPFCANITLARGSDSLRITWHERVKILPEANEIQLSCQVTIAQEMYLGARYTHNLTLCGHRMARLRHRECIVVLNALTL